MPLAAAKSIVSLPSANAVEASAITVAPSSGVPARSFTANGRHSVVHDPSLRSVRPGSWASCVRPSAWRAMAAALSDAACSARPERSLRVLSKVSSTRPGSMATVPQTPPEPLPMAWMPLEFRTIMAVTPVTPPEMVMSPQEEVVEEEAYPLPMPAARSPPAAVTEPPAMAMFPQVALAPHPMPAA